MWAEFFCLENITLKFLVIPLPASLQPLQLGCWDSARGKHPNEEKMVPEDASSILTSEMLPTESVTSSACETMTLIQRCELKLLTRNEEGNGRYQSSLQLVALQCHTGQMRNQFYETTGQYYYLFLKTCSTIAKTWTSCRFTKGFSRWSTKPSALKQL